MSTLKGIVFCACLAACGGLPTPTVETTSASVVTFDRYRTFTFEVAREAPSGFEVSERTVDVQHRMMPLVANALVAKGYESTPSLGELRVVVVAGEGEASKERHRTRTATAVMGEHEENITVPAGSLIIEVFDARGQRVWQSVAIGEVQRGNVDESRLAATITQMMSSFPPRRR